MKETKRLVAVLFTITAVAAIILGLTNAYTEPIIEENARIKYEEALKGVYPGAESFETLDKDYSENKNIEVVEQAMIGGEVDGYIFSTVGTGGYGGNITFVIGINNAGEVVGFDVLSASETPGFGAAIMEDEYKDRVIGSTSADDIDAITGATVTSTAMDRGYQAVFNEFNVLTGAQEEVVVDKGEVFTNTLAEIFPDAEVEDQSDVVNDDILYAAKVMKDGEAEGYGCYVITPEGFGGPIEFVVGFDVEGKISGFKTIDHVETEGYGAAMDSQDYQDALIGKASAKEIDGISGATLTTKAYKPDLKQHLKPWKL